MIDWAAFVVVFIAAFLGATVIVSTYALGIRLLTISGRTPIVTPAEFTDAITVITPAEAKAAAKKAAKAAKKSPLTDGQKRAAYVGAWTCFVLSALSVIVGIFLIVPAQNPEMDRDRGRPGQCAQAGQRMRLFADKQPRHRAALKLAVDKSGYGKKQLPTGRAWGVAVHESFDSVVAYVVEASVREGRPVLHRVTAGVHCNLAVNPRSVEAQVQGAAVMGLSMCLPGSAITLKDGAVEQSNFGDFTVARITDMPAFDVHIVPSAEPPTGMGEPGLPALAPAFANAIARLTGKPLRQLPFNLA